MAKQKLGVRGTGEKFAYMMYISCKRLIGYLKALIAKKPNLNYQGR